MAEDRTVPCATCPWRKSSTVGGYDIPGFNICKMRGLRNTVGHDDAIRPMMACHYSPEGDERVCIGYVAREGWRNIAVRMQAITGKLDIGAVMDAAEGLDLWESFDEMLAAYEDAADSPAVSCRECLSDVYPDDSDADYLARLCARCLDAVSVSDDAP